jgi:hypothetical protein
LHNPTGISIGKEPKEKLKKKRKKNREKERATTDSGNH